MLAWLVLQLVVVQLVVVQLALLLLLLFLQLALPPKSQQVLPEKVHLQCYWAALLVKSTMTPMQLQEQQEEQLQEQDDEQVAV